MLCDKCWGMLRGHDGKQWKGTYNLTFEHHNSWETFKTSSRLKCGICHVLDEEWTDRLGSVPSTDDDNKNFRSTAALGVVEDIEESDIYRLDFRLESRSERSLTWHKKTFILKEINSSAAPFRTPISGTTSSGEVLRLALSWISQCDEKCTSQECSRAQGRPDLYPTRLLNLRQLKLADYRRRTTKGKKHGRASSTEPSETVENAKVSLVDTDAYFVEDEAVKSNPRYVTLSHCWGGMQPYTLSPDTEDELRAGVELRKLPKTFQDAIRFASQLHKVGWVWIDSLCIIQDGPEHEKDWLSESARMQSVYKNAYLNISATAAANSSAGLYYQREPKVLWEDEVNLNVDGIPRLNDRNLQQKALPDRAKTAGRVASEKKTETKSLFRWFWSVDEVSRREHKPTTAKVDWRGERPLVISLPQPAGIRRCVLIEASYWDKLVTRAPVNTRAWVLQERLMAPRVLHFCRDQIAWECSTFTAAEGHPESIPKFGLRNDRIQPEIPVKGLDPMKHGKQLRQVRLQGAPEPDAHIPKHDLYAFELWARVVETYSRLNFTNARDKLIALSGIAEQMSHVLGASGTNMHHPRARYLLHQRPLEYVAGLWDKYFESQLLWRVDPVFDHSDGTFRHPSRRPKTHDGKMFYRAPSFSWASVDAQYGQGVTYGEVTDRDLLIKVASGLDCSPEPPISVAIATENKYGLVSGGHIMLWCRLRKIKIRSDSSAPGRYYWHLVDRPGLEKEAHRNIYLDAPHDDQERHHILDASNTYCIPAAYGSRIDSEDSKYIVCLLLQQAAEDNQVQDLGGTERRATFRRIGVAKLSTWADKLAHPRKRGDGIMKPDRGRDMELPGWPFKYREATGEHLIRVI